MPRESKYQAIVYVSASVLPMTLLLQEGLLVEARRLNAESGVTGALIYSDGTFIQYFEGAPEAMSRTYDRIRRSRLHSRLVEMMNEPVEERLFPSWTMALANPPASELLTLSTASWVVENARVGGSRRHSPGVLMLRHFWERQRLS